MLTLKIVSPGREFALEVCSYEVVRGDDCDRLMTFDTPFNSALNRAR